MRSVGTPFRIILAAFLLVASLATLSSAPGLVTCAWSQGTDPVAQGNDLYNQGKFKEAADLLKGAINKGEVKPADLGAARELLARSMVKADMRGEARETFKAILRKDAAYRPDPNKVPPDEVAVFDEALRDYQAEQLEQGKRVPASIGGIFGYGMYNPKDINDAITKFDEDISSGGADEIKGDTEFGGSVRLPLRPRLSLDLELLRFRSSVSDTGAGFFEKTTFEISAIPMVASLYYNAWSKPKIRVNVFGGLGPMFVSELKVNVKIPSFPVAISESGTKTGFYGHLGLEGEYLITPRLALSGRVLGRMASAGKVISYDTKGETETYARFNDKGVSFSGLAFNLGLRAYIGY